MFRATNHLNDILSTLKGDREKIDNDDPLQMKIICKNNEVVRTPGRLLSIFIPFLRNVADTIQNPSSLTIFLSEFTKSSVEEMIRIVRMEWTENDSWNNEVIELLHTINIDVGKCMTKRMTNLDFTEHMKKANKNIRDELELEKFSIDPNTNFAQCPNCPRRFSGSASKMRDKLKCHIGYVHYQKDILNEVKKYFNNSDSCKECGKRLSTIASKKKHLIFNHSKYVEEIKSIASEAAMNAVPERNVPVKHVEANALNDSLDKIDVTDMKALLEQPRYDDDVENLLKSDDDDGVETAAIQSILQSQGFSDESDDEDESSNQIKTKNTTREIVGINAQLIPDQNMSESDEEEEALLGQLLSLEESKNAFDTGNNINDINEDDASIIQLNLLQDHDISDDDD